MHSMRLKILHGAIPTIRVGYVSGSHRTPPLRVGGKLAPFAIPEPERAICLEGINLTQQLRESQAGSEGKLMQKSDPCTQYIQQCEFCILYP